MTFEEWWALPVELSFPDTGVGLKEWSKVAYSAGIDSVNALPHRAMFDEGYELGFKEGLERAAEMVKQHMEEDGEPCESCDKNHLSCAECIVEAIREEIKR